MITPEELERMRARIERIERELGGAKLELAALERRAGDGGAVGGTAVVASVAEKVEAPMEARAESVPPPLPQVAPLPLVRPVAAAPVVSVAPRAPVLEREAEPSVLRDWLERLQLWPPAAGEEGNAEARLGAWWATRIGALLAVIGVVFFGVYVSLHTPPWVKFCELLAVALGVTALGAWLERRLPAFGAVVFAGGLALGFFTAYAGHVAPAVRVFDSMWASVFWQGVAVAVIVGAALWRRAPLIATLAIGLGHVTAVFSGRGGFDGFALGAAALLGVVAVALRRMRGWEAPSVVAMPAGYAVFAFGLHSAWRAGGGLLPFEPWLFLAGMAVLYFLRDWRSAPVDAADVPAGEKWFQNANASLAVLAAWTTALVWYREQLGEFYLVVAALFATAAWLRTRQVRGGDAVAAVFTAKAVGALTLGVVELVDARTVALALLVQAWVLAWTARRLASRVLAVGSGVAAAVGTSFFFGYGVAATPAWSVMAVQAVGFVLGLTAWATAAGRWLVKDADARRGLDVVVALVGGLGALLAVTQWTPERWLPLYGIMLALLFLGVAVWRRSRAAAWAAAGVTVVAQMWLWIAAGEKHAVGPLGWNALAVLVPTIAAGAWMGAREESGWRVGGLVAWALAVVGAVLTAFGLWSGQVALVAVLGGALVVALGSASWPTRHLAWLATLGAMLGWVRGFDDRVATEVPGLLALAAVAALALPVGLRAWARLDAVRRAEPMSEVMERLQVLIATVLALRAVNAGLDGAELVAGLAGLALVLFAVALRPGVRPALVASWVVWLAMALVVGVGRTQVTWWPVAAGALLAWAPVWALRRVPAEWTSELTGWRRHAGVVQCGFATLIGLLVAERFFVGVGDAFALVALTLAAAFTYKPGREGAARVAAVIAAGALAWCVAWLIAGGEAEGWGLGLGATALAAVVLVWLPLWLDVGRDRGWRYTAGGVALGLLFAACAAQRGGLAPFATLGWGVTAIGFFMLGLFRRIAPYRVLGLVGLALCVPRVFVVDLQSTLHRIAAFIVIGVVMLWVGFSYHRFRHLVTDSSDSSENPSSSK